MLRFIGLLLVLVSLHLQSTHAQEIPVQRGEKIRVTARSMELRWLVGMFQSMDTDTLRVLAEPDASALTIPLDELDRIDVTRGQRSRCAEGAVLGAVVLGIGFGAAAALSYEEPEPCEGWFCLRMFDYDEGEMFLMGFFGGAVLGGVVGGLIGSNFQTDRWDEVQLDRVSLSLSLQRGGTLALGLEFPL